MNQVPKELNPPIVQFTLRQRPLVIFGSLVAAAVIAALLAWSAQWQREFFELAGTFMTAWALVLAIFIYIVSTAVPGALAEDVKDLQVTLDNAFDDTGDHKMDADTLRKNLVEFSEYVRRLQEKYKVPSQDIVYLDRAPQKNQERNRAVLIHTRHGKRYSVFHGGAGGGWHVTKY